MGIRIDTATATQAQPTAADATGAFQKGAVYIQATGSGSGTWSAKYNFAPVGTAGVIGSVRSLTISNAAPMADMDLLTGVPAFIGWWSNVSGTVTLRGSIDG